jgi:hypothetical protein
VFELIWGGLAVDRVDTDLMMGVAVEMLPVSTLHRVGSLFYVLPFPVNYSAYWLPPRRHLFIHSPYRQLAFKKICKFSTYSTPGTAFDPVTT